MAALRTCWARAMTKTTSTTRARLYISKIKRKEAATGVRRLTKKPRFPTPNVCQVADTQHLHRVEEVESFTTETAT